MRYTDGISDDPFGDNSEMTEDELLDQFRKERNEPLTEQEITDQNGYLLKRQLNFRLAAEYVTMALMTFPVVKKIVLFGSVAKQLEKEIPRFAKFRRERFAVWHECKDVDIAVWVNDLTCLNELRKASSRALNTLLNEKNIGIAHHQVDMFIMEYSSDRYLGNLCKYGTCPKGKPDCNVPGCGEPAFLQIYEDFILDPEALAPNRVTILYERS